jgi:hypothetical protein
MQRLGVSGAVGHMYVIRWLKVKQDRSFVCPDDQSSAFLYKRRYTPTALHKTVVFTATSVRTEKLRS